MVQSQRDVPIPLCYLLSRCGTVAVVCVTPLDLRGSGTATTSGGYVVCCNGRSRYANREVIDTSLAHRGQRNHLRQLYFEFYQWKKISGGSNGSVSVVIWMRIIRKG